MPQYLFRFGFESPIERKTNLHHGTDFESSEAIRVEASSEDEALEWGRVLASTFVSCLFAPESVDWVDDGFAHWIETEASEQMTEVRGIPLVKVGEHPDYVVWLDEDGG